MNTTFKNIKATGASSRFLLLLFLVFSAATQCMKRATVSKPLTLQDIQNDRTSLIKWSISTQAYEYQSRETSCINYIVFQNNWPYFYKQISDHTKKEKYKHCLTGRGYLNFCPQGYSCLGLTTIAIISSTKRDSAPFVLKKKLIDKLMSLHFIPTSKDKEFAIIEQWDRWQPMIHKICLLRSAHNDPINVVSLFPYEIIHHIEFLLLNTEQALF